jgi:predicted XRE-type DNA-binding protein
MNDDTDTAIQKGSANLFADLGFADPESHLLRAQLVSRMVDVIHAQKLSQVRVAALTGLGQPDVSRLLNGQFRDVSVERIMRMLVRLGCEIDILVKPSGEALQQPAIHLQPVSA